MPNDHITIAAQKLIDEHGLDAEEVASAEYAACKCPLEAAEKLKVLVAVTAGVKLLHDVAKGVVKIAIGER